ncbi:MAG: GNAT family N-acetyltransferase [Deltaproteobacteria bacterium]|nr:GNAT family N-acetyltransferase [Deltaproteobacteria bacterium]
MMELNVFESPGQEWDEFASRYTDLIFYQSLWSEVLRKGLGGQPLYFYLKKGSEIVAGLPGILLNIKIFKILYASLPYGHFIGEKSYYSTFLELLEKEFRKIGIDQARIAGSPLLESFQLETFVPVTARCTLLDFNRFDKEKVRERYPSEVRRAVRKAEKNGLFIKRADSREEVETFHRLYLSSMNRNQAMAKYPLQWFYGLYEMLVQQRKADFIFAVKHPDQYAAGVCVVYSSTSVHYLHNGSDESFLESRPNDLIVDHIIQEGLTEGKAVLDFMGSDPNDLSLIRFKEKWGSQSRDIHTYVKNYHPFRCKIWEMGKRLASTGVGSKLVKTFRG